MERRWWGCRGEGNNGRAEQEGMERGKTSEAAAGAFGSVYLFFPVSYVASLTAGVQASGFTSRAPHSVCERGRRRRTTSSPLISLYCLLPSFRQLYTHPPSGTHLFLAWFSPGKGVDDDDEGSDSRNCSAFSVDSNTELFFSAVAQLRARLLLPVSTDFTWRW